MLENAINNDNHQIGIVRKRSEVKNSKKNHLEKRDAEIERLKNLKLDEKIFRIIAEITGVRKPERLFNQRIFPLFKSYRFNDPF